MSNLSLAADSRRLLIVRHGQAEPYCANDDGRKLTDVGIAQVQATANFIADHAYGIELLAYSPIVRATETAKLLQNVLQIAAFEVWPELVHMSTAGAVDDRLRGCGFDRVLLVSHMPLVAALEGYLLGAGDRFGAAFETAELSSLYSDDPYPGGWLRQQRFKP